jgi:tRNA-Thr(GGU) m(6)t(6)A37 methyltransferase TsaA
MSAAVEVEPSEPYALRPIGRVESALKVPSDAPRQGTEGAPDAWLVVDPRFERALLGVAAGDEVIVITWLHRADRDVLEVHPRDDPQAPLAGVFATRSQHRPNPLGLHRVMVREIAGTRLRIGPIEAIDGTPVVDLKAVLTTGGAAS